MRIVSKTMLVLTTSLLVPVIIVGIIAFVSMQTVRNKAIHDSEDVLLSAEYKKLAELTQGKAAELNRLFTQYYEDVQLLQRYYRFITESYDHFRLESFHNLYPDKPHGGLPGYGYIHPIHQTYADFDRRGTGAPWMPKRLVKKVVSDSHYRAKVSRQIHEVIRLNHLFSSLGEKYKATLNLVWIVLDSGVTNVFPPYNYNDVIKNDPTIVDLNESEEDYVRLLNPENNPKRKIKWLDPYFDHFKRIWMTSCVAPLYNSDEFLGSLGIDILLPTITGIIHDIGNGSEEYAFLISNTGNPIAISKRGIDDLLWDDTHKKAFHQTYLPAAEQQWDEKLTETLSNTSLAQTPDKNLRKIITDMIGGGVGTSTIMLSGQEKLISYSSIANTGWSIGLVTPMKTVLAPSNAMKATIDKGTKKTTLKFTIIAVLVVVISFTFGPYLHYLIVKPLIMLTRNIENMNWNNLTIPSQHKPGEYKKDEIGILRFKFDEMITTLRRAKDEIVEKTQQLQLFNEELEQRVQRRTNELEARNQELDAFSYSISHDLHAPLRVILGFSELLLKDHKDRLNEDGKQLLDRIAKRTTQMSLLLDNILNLARLGRKEVKLSVIDMKSMAVTVFDEAMASVHDRKIKFEIGELPFAKADENLIYQCWSNLISNAIKFTGKTENAWIQVSGLKKDGENIYCVKDNGAGFDMQYADRLFKEFKRLHTEKNFEGTGAGLAIVKRVIERHGGRVWAEGKVGEGASFYFALPADEQVS